MHLSFSDTTTRLICEDEEFAQNELGTDNRLRLRRRLADLWAIRSVDLIPLGTPEPFKDGEIFAMRMKISKTCFLTFCSSLIHPPMNTNNEVDWSKVNSIKILKIEY